MVKNEQTPKKRFYINTVMQYVMTFARYVFPLITFPYLTRVLEPDTYGIITYMTSTIVYFQIFIDFGFNLSATKDIAEHQSDNEYIGAVTGTVIQSKILLFMSSMAAYAVMILFIPILSNNMLLSILYMLSVALSIWLPDFLFRGIEKMEIITIRFLLSKSVTTALTFVAVKSKDDILWIPILNIIGSLIAIGLTWYHIKFILQIRTKYGSFADVWKNVSSSGVYFLSTFATTAFGATNTFMLGAMALPEAQIAYWGVSFNIISAAQSLYSPIVNSLYPHMVAKRDFKLVKKILYIFVPAIMVTAAAVFFFSDFVIGVFSGTQYLDAVPVFRGLLPVLVFSFPAMVIGFPVLGVLGKVKETTATTIISAVFHILGLILLIVIGKFSVLNVAILRSVTEFVLLGTRGYVLFDRRRRGKTL